MVAPLLYGLYVIGSGTAARVAVRKLAQTGAKVAGNLISRHRTKKAAEKASELFMKSGPYGQMATIDLASMAHSPLSEAIHAGKKKAGFKKGGTVVKKPVKKSVKKIIRRKK